MEKRGQKNHAPKDVLWNGNTIAKHIYACVGL